MWHEEFWNDGKSSLRSPRLIATRKRATGRLGQTGCKGIDIIPWESPWRRESPDQVSHQWSPLGTAFYVTDHALSVQRSISTKQPTGH